MSGWAVEHHRGSASDLHADSAACVAVGVGTARPVVRVLHATSRAVVLGRAEPAGHVDADRATAAGVAIARRSSGGGAVLVGPDESLWVDVVVPVGHARWESDVGRAMWWIGDLWVAALRRSGLDRRPVTTWEGALVRTPWSDRVCFAGTGPGEVVMGPPTAAGAAKVVGVAQRRTRAGALLQSAVPLRWRPADLLDVLALEPAERERAGRDLAGVAVGVGPESAAALLDAFVTVLGAVDHGDVGQLP